MAKLTAHSNLLLKKVFPLLMLKAKHDLRQIKRKGNGNTPDK
jgi:hypothetical protein